MKSLLLIIIALMFLSVGRAQDQDVRERLLSSKGNLKVSKLFRETPVLPIDDREAEIYRLTIIPTFYSPIKIRVEKRKANYLLIAKRLSGQGGFDAGKLKTEKRRRLTPREWERLVQLIHNLNFWELPYLEKQPEPEDKGESTVCPHGSEWVLEGAKNGTFHAVNRYCTETKTLLAIGLYLVKLSGLRLKVSIIASHDVAIAAHTSTRRLGLPLGTEPGATGSRTQDSR